MKSLEHTVRQRGALALVLVTVISGTCTAASQGILWFVNTAAGEVDAPIFDVDEMTPLAGPAFLAQLYAAAPGHSLQPIGAPVPFRTGPDAGYFNGDLVSVPSVPAHDGLAVVQVVAWRASDGPTFAVASHPGAHVGASSIFNVGPLADNGSPPDPLVPFLTGLHSFSLSVVVPEPSVFALGLLGGAALVLGRRRGRFRGRAARPPARP